MNFGRSEEQQLSRKMCSPTSSADRSMIYLFLPSRHLQLRDFLLCILILVSARVCHSAPASGLAHLRDALAVARWNHGGSSAQSRS
ncbi:hypothetical protein OG21DRAFT_1194684 [Imleria badia]|nr:hypothetical protein OG21DRAFT_1194684 [Imleria badia]